MLDYIGTPQGKAVITMFCITIVFGTIFWYPMTKVNLRDKVVNFYWAGFWAFLAIITATSGAQATLMLAGVETKAFADMLLYALTFTFVLFVMFAWAHLVVYGAGKLKKVIKT